MSSHDHSLSYINESLPSYDNTAVLQERGRMDADYASDPGPARVMPKAPVRLSRLAAIGAVLLAAVIPFAAAWALLGSTPGQLVAATGLRPDGPIELPGARAAIVAGLLWLPSPLTAGALLLLSRTFVALGACRAFEPATYRPLRGFALWLAASAAVTIAVRAIGSLVISDALPDGPSLAIWIGSPDLFTIGVALLAYVLADALTAACAVAAENRQFV